MSAFRFNFQVDDASSNNNKRSSNNATDSTPDTKSVVTPIRFSGKRFFPTVTEADLEVFEMTSEAVAVTKDFTLLKRKLPSPEKLVLGDELVRKAVQQSDVVPAVYEGGLKLWEGAIDLVAFLAASKLPLKGARVVELGCGHGLPGVFCMLQGAESVAFQDLNEDVLALATVSNVLTNSASTKLSPSLTKERLKEPNCSIQFFSGDWRSEELAQALGEGSYDFVLTSETIYSLEWTPHLLKLMKRLLKPSKGIAFIAAKRSYFGVGGSTQDFLDLVHKDASMSASVVKIIDDNMSNIREIVQVQRKPEKAQKNTVK